MTIIKGINNNVISINCNGKETTIKPPIPWLENIIFFDDLSAVGITFDRFSNEWHMRQYYKGNHPATLHLCSMSENSDTYETHAMPKKIRMLDKCAIETEVVFNDF